MLSAAQIEQLMTQCKAMMPALEIATRRERIATACLQGLITNGTNVWGGKVSAAVQLADDLIAELDK